MTIDDTTGEIAIQTDDRSQDGTYSIDIKAQITVPTDFSNTEFQTLESIHNFKLELFVPLELCQITIFDETILVEMVTSVLGEPQSQSFDEVQDSESKASGDNSGLTFCGPRIYSIIDLPPYIQFDPESREITLSTQDEADIGQFEIEFQVQLEDFPEVTKKAKFQVTVNPCIITDYSLIIDQTDISYTVNDPAWTTFSYSFVQANSCGYPETIIVDNPADFITHNEIARDFTVATSQRGDAQVHTIVLSSSISVFDDFTLTTKSEHSAQQELTVTVIDPCLTTQLPQLVIPDLEIKVHQGSSI